MEAMTALGLGRKVQTQLSEEMFRRAVYFAVEQDVRGQKPRPDKRTRTGDAAADTGGGEADSSGGGSGPCGFTYGDANDAEYVERSCSVCVRSAERQVSWERDNITLCIAGSGQQRKRW